MKKYILCSAFVLTIAGFASAQTTSKSRTPGKLVSTSSHTAKKIATRKTATTTIPKDNRKEYVKDGQLATSTGHEATPINSDEYQSPIDSANKKRKKQ